MLWITTHFLIDLLFYIAAAALSFYAWHTHKQLHRNAYLPKRAAAKPNIKRGSPTKTSASSCADTSREP